MNRFRLISVSVACSLVSSVPVMYPQGSEEECSEFRTERLFQCLQRDLIPNKITAECIKINSQGNCNNGERVVMHVNGRCATTKCIKNKDDSKICFNGTFPFKGECHVLEDDISCNIVTQMVDPNPKTNKYSLQVDHFGEKVTCGCNNQLGFILHDGDCYSEGSLAACKSEDQQLVW